MTTLILIAALAQGNYFATYSAEAQSALALYDDYKALLRSALGCTIDEDIALAFAIVAPEASQYSALSDYVETKVLEYKYVTNDECDYSIGLFQMKPSFVESLEKEVFSNATLAKKYSEWLAYSKGSNAKSVRSERLKLLSQTEWQIKYLAIFVDVVKLRTARWGLRTNEERVRCWATMYNAGFYLSKERVEQRCTVKQFPRGTKEFNYSAVALEFYKKLCSIESSGAI